MYSSYLPLMCFVYLTCGRKRLFNDRCNVSFFGPSIFKVSGLSQRVKVVQKTFELVQSNGNFTHIFAVGGYCSAI